MIIGNLTGRPGKYSSMCLHSRRGLETCCHFIIFWGHRDKPQKVYRCTAVCTRIINYVILTIPTYIYSAAKLERLSFVQAWC